MAGRFSDDEYSVGHEADFVDASADTEGGCMSASERWIGDRIHFRKMSGLPRESLMRVPST